MIATETDPGAGSRRPTKKPKLGSHEGSDVHSTPAVEPKPEKQKKTKRGHNPASEVVQTKDTPEENKRKDKKGRKKQAVEPAVSDNEGGDEAVEASGRDQSSSASGEEGSEYIPPVHQSLAGSSRPNLTSPLKKSKKHVPPDETPDQRDSRTIFVGNVPFQVMTTKVS